MVKIELVNRLNELKATNELKLISDANFSENVFMIVLDGEDVGYIVYDAHTSMIKKFEVVSTHQCKGVGRTALNEFLRVIKLYTDTVTIKPINESLFDWYAKSGFVRFEDKMEVRT